MAVPMLAARRSFPRSRAALLLSCALGAASLALADQARAQAYNGTPGTQAGSVTYNRGTPGIETITVNSPQAVILWNAGPGTFLPAGNTVTYQGSPGNGNYAVLNRINPNGAPIRLDGNIISRLSATNSAPGGTVAFYTPGGLIVGPNANFSVNRLLLTTSDVLFTAAGSFVSPNGQMTFVTAAPVAGTIDIQPGAQINATPEGAWVALWASSIVQGGNVRANGSVAYVAAQQGTLTYNAGLFDIVVTTGTNAATAINHTGSTRGPASTGAGDVHRVYMVAAPETAATQLLLGGNVGFDAPLGAAIENGTIVLSSGFDIVGDQPVRPANPAPPSATLNIAGATVTSSLTGFATTSANVSGNNNFSRHLSLSAPNVSVAANGSTITIGGNLSLKTTVPPLNAAQSDVTGGNAALSATNGGLITVGGSATVDASAFGRSNAGGAVGSGTGGTATVSALNGRIQIAGATRVLANGTSPVNGSPAPDIGGNGTGGTAQMFAQGGGMIQLGSTLDMQAFGRAATTSGFAITALTGNGGQISMGAVGNGSAITVAGATTADASGSGGSTAAAAGGRGGSGTGGAIQLIGSNGGQLMLNGALTADVRGTGGIGGAATGNGQGGTLTLAATGGGLVSVAGAATLNGSGSGGSGQATGGTGTGGTLSITASDAASAILLNGTVDATFEGVGGNGVRAGSGVGGRIDVTGGAGGARVQLGTGSGSRMSVDARGGNASSGTGSAAGTGAAGTIAVQTQDDGVATSRIDMGSIAFTANGTGGNGAQGGILPGETFGASNGATGQGGTVHIEASGLRGAIGGGDIVASANGQGGVGGAPGSLPGANGGSGTGGTVSVAVVAPGAATTGSGSVQFASLNGSANGRGGTGVTGGTGTGGTVRLTSPVGALAITGAAQLTSDGTGGQGSANGGNGQGGNATVQTANGAISVGGRLSLTAHGNGGAIAGNGVAGNGVGGTAQLITSGTGSAQLGGLDVAANGNGGYTLATAATAAQNGGSGTGGTAQVSVANGARLTVTGTSQVLAQGLGGRAGVAGGGTGGVAAVSANGAGSTLALGNTLVSAMGASGRNAGATFVPNAINGGNAQGGTANVVVANGASGTIGTGSTGLSVSAGASVDLANTGATGGTATGGSTLLLVDGGSLVLTGSATTDANAIGGIGLAGGAATGGNADINVLSGGTLRVNGGGLGSHANGFGGAASGAGVGGTGQGGTARIRETGSTLIGGDGLSLLSASGTGGASANGVGGTGTGGTARLTLAGGSGQFGGAFTARADGTGGAGIGGGGGLAGTVDFAQSGTVALGLGDGSELSATGTGGTGSTGTGGEGRGGNVALTSAAGSTMTGAGSVTLRTSATGGAGSAGGNATAGNASLIASGGTLALGSARLLTIATGGNGGAAGTGGNATAGTVRLTATSGQLTLTGPSTLSADAQAGAGGTAGQAQAGSLLISTTAGTIAGGDITGTARATGAAAGTNRGGLWNISAGAGNIGLGTVALTAAGDAGAASPASVLSAAGGRVVTSGVVTLITTGDVNAQATGAGQFAGGSYVLSGRNIAVTHNNPAAGASTFDTVNFTATPTGGFTTAFGSVIRASGGLRITAGGAVDTRGSLLGGDIAVSGTAIDLALANGRNLDVRATNGLTVTQAIATGNIAFQAGGIANFGSARAGGSFTGNAGALTLPQVTAAVVDVTTAGVATLGTVTGSTSLSVSGGSGVTFMQLNGGAVALTSANGNLQGGNIAGSSATLVGRAIDAGVVTVTGDIAISTPGSARFTNVSAGGGFTGSAGALVLPQASAAVVDLTTGGTATLGTLTGTTSARIGAAGNIAFNQINGGVITLTSSNGNLAGGNITGASATLSGLAIDAGTVTMTGNVAIWTPGLARFTNVSVGGSLTGSAGSLVLPQASAAVVDLTTGGTATLGTLTGTTSARIGAAGNIAFNQINGGVITLTSSNGNLAGGNITGASATLTGQAIDLGTVNATGNVGFTAAGAARFASVAAARFEGTAASLNLPSVIAPVVDVSATTGTATLGTVHGTNSIRVRAAGAVNFTQLTGGTVALSSTGGGITGAAASGSTIDFDAAQTVSLTGTVAGGEIRILSRDIDLGAAARLGDTTTQLVELTARPSGLATVIGGTAQGPGYTLTDTEAGRIRTAQLTIAASAAGTAASRTPDIVLRDLTLSATPNGTGGAVNRFTVQGGSGTILQVDGAVRLDNAGTTDGITITAPGRFQMNTDTGSIRVRNAAGQPIGELILASDNIWSGSAALITQLAADPNFAGRNEALRNVGGAVAPRGFIEGGNVTLRGGTSIYVQNSGTLAALAGLTVGNRLTITPTGATPLDVYGFGRRINADGSFVINAFFFLDSNFTRQGVGFTGTSQFNLCTINSGICTGLLGRYNLPDTRDQILGPLADNGEAVSSAEASDRLELGGWDCPSDRENCRVE